MEVELEYTENIQTFDLKLGDKLLDGEITNRSAEGGFFFRTSDLVQDFSSEELRAIASRLDELNNF